MTSEDKTPDPFEETTSESIDDQAHEPEFGPFPSMPPPYYHRPPVRWRLIIWSVFGMLAAIILVAYGQAIFSLTGEQIAEERPHSVTPPTPTQTPSTTPSATPTTRVGSFTFTGATATPTPVPGGMTIILRPALEDTGWVTSEEENIDTGSTGLDLPNHFGDSYLYSGILDGKIYHAAFQFDLSLIPRGTEIYGASLRLTPLRTDLLDGKGRGEWQLHLLTPEINNEWQTINYEQLHNAAKWDTLEPLAQTQLGVGLINDLEFSPQQLALLERRILDGDDQFGPRVSFRLDGPMEGGDNLFAWDSGYGLSSRGAGPELFLNLGPVPSVAPTPEYVIITSTPTPDNIITAVANSLRMTAEATRVGTITPLPPQWVTPWLVTATPTPENIATAQALYQLATAIAQTTGAPPNAPNMRVVTSTPEPSLTPTPTYVVVTSTPAPENVMTAVANSLQMTAEAEQGVFATAVPSNWVTPLVVTATPTPENIGTAQALNQLATAISLTTGTPTSLPVNAQTATPTPIFEYIEPLVPPTPTATPSATPQTIPSVFLGKIVFLSDREEGLAKAEAAAVAEEVAEGEEDSVAEVAGATADSEESGPRAYVYDLETGQLGRLTSNWPYQVAADREPWSADGQFRVFTKDAIRNALEKPEKPEIVPELYVFDYIYEVEWQLTKFGAGIAWGGVWSPTSNEIAFISSESRDDEIWVVNYDGSNLRRLTSTNEAYNAREIGKDTFVAEVNHHPSWSPDGEQIVFASNRTGKFQLWVMNKDGSEQRLLMDWNPYNDWDPIWIKDLDTAPPLVKEPD